MLALPGRKKKKKPEKNPHNQTQKPHKTKQKNKKDHQTPKK